MAPGWSSSAPLSSAGSILLRAGDAVTGWALRRPGDHADRTSSRSLPRRRWSHSVLLSLLAMDHASVWRSTPLRRGVLVLVLVPGVVSAFAGMSWQSLILVPGLIAAGAGLLFGINAFTLDGAGSVWLSTLPGLGLPRLPGEVAGVPRSGDGRRALRLHRGLAAGPTAERAIGGDRGDDVRHLLCGPGRRPRDAFVTSQPAPGRTPGATRHPGNARA